MESVHEFFFQIAPLMPPDFWWVTAAVIVILAATAIIDAFTALVPDALILSGLIAVTAAQGFGLSWDIAALHLRHAIAAGIVIWAVNWLWFRFFGRDALGMGDAKWTMLAVACFGSAAALFAWGCGAVVAVIFIALMRVIRHRILHVTFAPFLLIGLCVGVYWLRFAE